MVLMSKLVHHMMLYVMLGGGRARTVVPHWHCAEVPLCLAWVLAEHGNMVCHTAPIPDMADTDYNCYDKDLQTDFYLFTRCTDTGVIATHALSFYQPLATLFLLTHAQLAVVTQSCALLYITAHCDLLLQ